MRLKGKVALVTGQWTRLVDVNLRGEWLCSQIYCRRAVAEKGKGSIVNIGSIQAGKVRPGHTHLRAGTPREIGAVAAGLASEEASYVTGQSIFVDGGWVGK